MNIYDETLEFISELEVSKDYLFEPVLKNIIKALERAKKVEELKDLYSHLSYIRLCLFCETDTNVGQNIMNEDEAINKKIKILEKELEDME